MLSTIDGGDIVYFGHVPELPQFAELGDHIPADTLYRAEFTSWEQANTTQRSKSRRKHDRQQGERLEALGQVTFAELGNDDDLAPVLDVMFRQRAARFAAMGVADPFAPQRIRDFYYRAAAPDSDGRRCGCTCCGSTARSLRCASTSSTARGCSASSRR